MTLLPATSAPTADTLADDEIHVWPLAYQRASGRAPLHGLLARYLAIDPAEVVLDEGAHGRPTLAARHGQTLDFNWSHSGAHALVALGRHVRPGIDIELLRPRPRAMEIARRYFSAEEIAALERRAPDQRDAAFLALWTAKEAILKSLGRGIAFGLHRLTVAGEDGQLELRWLDDDDAGAWQLRSLDLGDGFCAALAWRGGPRRVRIAPLAMAD